MTPKLTRYFRYVRNVHFKHNESPYFYSILDIISQTEMVRSSLQDTNHS